MDFKLAALIAAQPTRAGVIALAISSLAVVGLLDYVTGYQISFAVFYLVPVGVAAWYCGAWSGSALALGSSFAWYAAERAAGYPYDHPAIPLWNAFVRLCFFLIIAALLSALRGRLRVERQLAKTDALTGVLNLRAFEERLEHDLDFAARTRSPITLAYIDIDDFKRVNDAHGHSEGDRLLRAVATTLRSQLRRADSVARLGGDEFALILPGTDLAGANAVMSEIGEKLGGLPGSGPGSVTCSIGAVVFRDRPPSADDAVAAADRLMYTVKYGGKNAALVEVHTGSHSSKSTPDEGRGKPDGGFFDRRHRR
jgi:diguanylate cyclase (GGDEF)-like protein